MTKARQLIESKLQETSASPKSFQTAIDNFVFEMVQAITKGLPRNLTLDGVKSSSRGEVHDGGFVNATGTSKSDLECHSEVILIQRRDMMSFEAKCRWFDATGRELEMEFVLRPFDGYETLVHKVLQWFSQF